MVSSTQLFLVALSALEFTSATNVHVNRGCILIDGGKFCQGSSAVIDDGSAKIHGRFSGNPNAAQENSGCVLDATWFAEFGDVYYGEDDCLYDARGQNIGGQCCTSGQEFVDNPYFQPS